ncbi:magnesium-dependent phosphatase-1 [Chlamydoabsidia padenii]|nr:magnesium-dependent phosphatase-1 [Chlamydoabsidia padenii]
MPQTDTFELPKRLPKLIVFDLDCTLWTPWIDYTYGPPFTYHEEDNFLKDKMGEKLVLFKHITTIFKLIQTFPDTKIGIASRTGTPDWARIALKLFKVSDDTTLHDTIDYMEIYPGRKTQHLTELAQSSGIACEDMLFFDDERRNADVKTLGVHFILVDPAKGVTMHQFKTALQLFDRQSKMVQTTLPFEPVGDIEI